MTSRCSVNRTMKLKKLLQGIDQVIIRGSKDLEITGVCAHSDKVAPGNLFVVKRGASFDGACFIPQALAAGAVAILTDLYDPLLKEVTQLITPHPAAIEARLADACYGHPSRALFCAGITGTNGKTTTAYLARHLLEHCFGEPCGLIGTIEYSVGECSYVATHTTPDVCTLHKLLAEMVRNQCRAAVIEVTSHAMVQGRTAEVAFDAAIFTNLGRDHLDYHKNVASYLEAKASLFAALPQGAVALLNGDDPAAAEIAKVCRAPILRYGIADRADLQATSIEEGQGQIAFDLLIEGHSIRCRLPLIGVCNLYNALAAVALAYSRGATPSTIAEGLASASPPPGRLEAVPNALGLSLYVDFAHTPDAFEAALRALSPLKRGRLIALFGCGGDRDRGKRPLMAQVAARHCDYAVVTNDNPRTEEPQAIAAEITSGFPPAFPYEVELDREEAMERALRGMEQGDLLLVAGKGHETAQHFGTMSQPFCDRAVLEALCAELAGYP